MYPFPVDPLREVMLRYRKSKEWVWVQEESLNMGAWTFMEPRLRALTGSVKYLGRDTSASPATGSLQVHKREQKELVEAAIGGTVPHLVRARSDNGPASKEQPRPREERTAKPAKT